MKLRTRLTLFGGGVVGLALVLFGLLLYALLARGAFTNQDDALRSRADAAASSLTTSLPNQPPIASADLATSTDVFIEILAADGTVTYTTGELHGAPVAIAPAILDRATSGHGVFTTVGPLRLYVRTYAEGFFYCNGIAFDHEGHVVVVERRGLQRVFPDGSREWVIETLGRTD